MSLGPSNEKWGLDELLGNLLLWIQVIKSDYLHSHLRLFSVLMTQEISRQYSMAPGCHGASFRGTLSQVPLLK